MLNDVIHIAKQKPIKLNIASYRQFSHKYVHVQVLHEGGRRDMETQVELVSHVFDIMMLLDVFNCYCFHLTQQLIMLAIQFSVGWHVKLWNYKVVTSAGLRSYVPKAIEILCLKKNLGVPLFTSKIMLSFFFRNPQKRQFSCNFDYSSIVPILINLY